MFYFAHKSLHLLPQRKLDKTVSFFKSACFKPSNLHSFLVNFSSPLHVTFYLFPSRFDTSSLLLSADSDIKPDGDSSFESVAQCQLELDSHAFCRGHVCTPWLEVYMIASGQSRPTGIYKKASNGVVNLVPGVWQYTMAVYFFRNATVHGKLPQFPVGKSLQQMRDEAATVYEKFTNDPHGILSA